MAIQSSYHTVAEQVITFNNNVVELLSKINSLVTTTDPSVTVNVSDPNGVIRQVNLPSFGFLKSEIDRLNNNLNSIYSINEAGALIQPSNGTKFRKIVTVDLNREPNQIGTLPLQRNFKASKNWFFDGLLNPQLFTEIDLSGLVENNVRKILCRRYIPTFATDVNGNLTPLGQSALNSFNSTFRNQNGFTLDNYLNWHISTPGLVEPSNPNYDEQMFDLEPNRMELDGVFTVIRIEEDTVNKKLWYHVDTLEYAKTQVNDDEEQIFPKQLAVGDELIINTPISTTRYKITEISTSASNPRLRFERVEGLEPIPVGTATLKIYSPVIYNKKVKISIGYNERNVIFLKALNMDNFILSKDWSTGVGFWTNELRQFGSSTPLDQFYIDNVMDYGTVLSDLVAKKTPNTLAGTPNKVQLLSSNFKVVQINKHLTDTPDSNSLKNKHNQQKTLKSEVQQLTESITEKNKQSKVQRFASDAERKQFLNEVESLNRTKESKSKLLSSITSEIIDLSRSPLSKAEPSFRVRGFWSIPEAVITRGTKPQEVVQFRVQYRYTSKDGRETPVETFRLGDRVSLANPKTAAFSNWQELKTDARKRVLDQKTGQYFWELEDLTDADTPNINQLDIPIKFGERVEIKIKSISEVGWPESPVESDWSDIISVEFPDDLNNVLNENDFILKEADKEDLRAAVQSDLTAKGLDDHLSEQVVVNNITYYHSTDKILSGFKDDTTGNSLDLFEYLRRMENRIIALEERIKRVKGELQVIVFRNSEQFAVKNGTELTFNIECEDYLDKFSATGVPTGRVYQNNVYVIKEFLLKVKNKSVDSPLGLLSNRIYSSTANSEVYNLNSPQVFWVDPQNELIIDNSTGVTNTQINNQFIWSVNYDSVNQTAATKLAENVGNNFITDANNSVTNVLGTTEFNLGWNETAILGFVGNNLSLLDSSKWIDTDVSVSSTTRLLTTIHPQIQSLDKVQETNADKVRSLAGGDVNDINIPINIYFKLNALDPTVSGANYQYVNFNGATTTVRHVKKVKFLMENESENKPFVFTVRFVINRTKIVMNRVLTSTPTQLTTNS